jgi:hypothetical protein
VKYSDCSALVAAICIACFATRELCILAHIILTVNSDYFPTKRSPVCGCHGDTMCLL